jgi:hypothetical protein
LNTHRINLETKRLHIVSKDNLAAKLMLMPIRNSGFKPPTHGNVCSDQWMSSIGTHDCRNLLGLELADSVRGEKHLTRFVVVHGHVQERAIWMTPNTVEIRLEKNLRPLPDEPAMLNTPSMLRNVVCGVIEAGVLGGIRSGRNLKNQRRINRPDLAA